MKKHALQSLWEIMEMLHQVDQMESALSGTLDLILEIAECEEGSVWILNREDKRYYAMIHAGKKDISGFSVAAGESIVGKVSAGGASEYVKQGSSGLAQAYPLSAEQGAEIPQNMLCIPLKNIHESLGCILLTNLKEELSEDDRKICENMASLLAMVMEEKGFSAQPNQGRKPMITLRNVIKEYGSGETVNQVLKGIDLEIFENELLVVLGESGCGKSTMLNIIGGMDTMTHGELTIDGKDMSRPTEEELTNYRRNFVGFIFQNYNLMPNLTAQENIEFIAEIVENPMDSAASLDMVGLKGREGNFPSQMSGGQQQRVSIARAFAKRPRLILADEPTAALDFQTGQEVLMVMENAIKQTGTTIVMITHNVEIAKMANRVVKLKNGKVHSIRVNLHPLSASELVW